MNYKLKETVFVGLIGVLSYLFGNNRSIIYALFTMNVMDYILGVLLALVMKTYNSRICVKGIVKKIFIICLVSVGHIVDLFILKDGDVMRNLICLFFISNEGISIIENAGKLGLPVPRKLLDLFVQIENKIELESAELPIKPAVQIDKKEKTDVEIK